MSRRYSDRTERELRKLLEQEQQAKKFRIGEITAEIPGERHIRWARTTTSADNPTYPTAPARKFVVEFGSYAFDNTVITDEAATFTAYTPAHERIAYSPVGWLPENSIVRTSLHGIYWHIIPDWWMTRHKAVVTQSGGIALNGSGTVTIYKNQVATSWTVTAHYNWLYNVALAENQRVVIQWYADENSGGGQWVIEIPWC